jgi:hypothetical protein
VDIAFGLQLGVGPLHGDDGQVQMLRQGPFGGQPLPGGQGAGEDVPPDAPVQVFVQGQISPLLHGVGQHGAPPSDLIKKIEIEYFNHIISAV